MITITTQQAKTHLSRFLNKVLEGEEIIIKRGNTPVARIVPLGKKAEKSRLSVGQITSDPVKLSDDAFYPLTEDELKDWGL
ncbi:MAG: type II toxin-antitoxin system prevent-host-death family antitoxin [Spirochaetes bacterium]|nr:MAG: type II toxin-antitoxin system prevent-host-death family antitoxin [Spirochaetota bacterium]